jgi:fluoride ion exporter CrcB/FEX
MLLVEEAAGLAAPYGLLFGVLVGVVAIVPAEIGLFIWRARLSADSAITIGQRTTAVFAMIMAGIFSALTTSSFFSYFLPQLFPSNYLAIAPAMNVGAIVGSWIVFIMSIVFYSIFSRYTQQNLSQAKARQSIFDARMVILRSAGEAIRAEAENIVNDMNARGVFRQDAQDLILASLGMAPERLHTNLIGRGGGGDVDEIPFTATTPFPDAVTVVDPQQTAGSRTVVVEATDRQAAIERMRELGYYADGDSPESVTRVPPRQEDVTPLGDGFR